MLLITVGSLSQQNSQNTGPVVFPAPRRLRGQPALSLRSLSQQPSTSQWLLNRPKSNMKTNEEITQWHSTHCLSRTIITGKRQLFKTLIISFSFIFFWKSSNLENNNFLCDWLKFSRNDSLVTTLKMSKYCPVNQAILLKCEHLSMIKNSNYRKNAFLGMIS